MPDRLRTLLEDLTPTAISGELALMAAALGILVFIVSLLAPGVQLLGGGVALGLWLAAQYANQMGQ